MPLATIEVRVPVLPESVTDATLVHWHKQSGEVVQRGENLLDLETDKIVLAVPAPHSGILQPPLKAVGEVVKSGDLLVLLTELNAVEDNKPQPVAPVVAELQQSPAVRHLLAKQGLTAADIAHASGKGGRLTKGDVLEHLAAIPVPPQEPQAQKQEEQKQEEQKQEGTISEALLNAERLEKRVPMTRLRAKIAERLLQAQHQAALLTTFNEVNLQAVMDMRQRHQAAFQETHGVKLGIMSFFVTACVEALKRYPVLNAAIEGTDIIYHGYFDIGIAIAAPRGLVVPVLRDADQKSLAQIEQAIQTFSQRAKNDQLTLEELRGGTFTLSNGGVFGSLLSTPIINPPQSAILGMHTIQQRPIAENGQVVIRPMMYVALSYDHRLIDGREAVQFLVAIKQLLEDPTRLLLKI